jgi:histone acetyltransferase (RNA polymerase elongator complex component)
LGKLYLKGAYQPLSLAEAVQTAKDMSLILKAAGIHVIRIGLKSSDNIAEGRSAMGGTFHPAFRQLVESEIAKDMLESQLKVMVNASKLDSVASNDGDNYYSIDNSGSVDCSNNSFNAESIENLGTEVYFFSNKRSFSNMVGNKKANKDYFAMQYPELVFIFKIDPSLADNVYIVKPMPSLRVNIKLL